MKIGLKIALYPFLMAFLTLTGMAQKGVEDGSRYGHGEDSVRCIKNISLYRENTKHGNYDMAVSYTHLTLPTTPYV